VYTINGDKLSFFDDIYGFFGYFLQNLRDSMIISPINPVNNKKGRFQAASGI